MGLGENRRNPAWRSLPIVVITAKELTPEERVLLSGSTERVIRKGAQTQQEMLDEIADIVRERAEAGVGPLSRSAVK